MKKLFIAFLLIVSSITFAQSVGSDLRKAKNNATREDYAAAAKEYQAALKADSNNYKANFEYGLLLIKYLNNPPEAGKYLLKAESLSKKDTATEIVFGLAEYYQYMGQNDKAISYYNRCLPYLEHDEDGMALKARIERDMEDCRYAQAHPEDAKRQSLKIINAGPGVNTIYPEYVPVVNKNETVLVFTSRRKNNSKSRVDEKDGAYMEDMYLSQKNKDGVFDQAHLITITDPQVKEFNNTEKKHESVISISYNGDKFYTYKEGKIYESDLKNNAWTAPRPMDTTINGDVFQNHMTITKDNKTIYFSSIRKGGKGGLDIYKTELQPDGKWSAPVNLENINTSDDDGSPQISEDGRTLYFASKGWKGYGGYDLYKSVFNGKGWSAPVNMGEPFNSPGDDIYLTVNAKETHGYFSSNRKGGIGDMDIYMIYYDRKPFEDFTIDSLNRLSFTAPDTVYVNQLVTMKAQSSKISLADMKTFNWAVNDELLAPHTDNITYTFTKAGTYKVRMEAQMPDDDFIGAQKTIIVVEKPAELATNTFGLEPVYFDFARYRLNEEAKAAVERNIKTLEQHPDATIEVAAFCDSRGSAAYNYKLSQRRARAISQYLKQKGFDIKRVKHVEWFGEKDPVNNCKDGTPCTEAEYKLNRRGEFRLTK